MGKLMLGLSRKYLSARNSVPLSGRIATATCYGNGAYENGGIIYEADACAYLIIEEKETNHED
jgi:hypothetical protein